MKKFGALLLIILALIAIWYSYIRIGGSKPLEFRIVEKSFRVIGLEFRGSYTSSQLEAIFTQMRDLSDSLKKPLVVINYGSDTEAKTVDQFIGIAVDNNTSMGPYQVRAYEGSMVTTTINVHNAVMPQPREVRSAADSFAVENSRIIQDISLEVYLSTESLEVYFPVGKSPYKE